MEENFLGIDLGCTNIKATLMNGEGDVVARVSRPTRDGEETHGVPAWAISIKSLLLRMEAEHGSPVSVGISCPGLMAPDERSVACMPDRLTGIVGLDWSRFLERREPVVVINDAHAALLAEVHLGAARGMRNVYMIVIGTGVGGAILVDGQIRKGHIGRAGHLGHICLDPDGAPGITGLPGSLEDWIGNHNIAERSDGAFAATHDLIAAYGEGDEVATRVWLRSVRALACAVASLNNVLDPEAVVIGGGIGKAGPLLMEPLEKELDRIEWRPLGEGVPIIPAHFDEWAGSIGAAIHGRMKGEGNC